MMGTIAGTAKTALNVKDRILRAIDRWRGIRPIDPRVLAWQKVCDRRTPDYDDLLFVSFKRAGAPRQSFEQYVYQGQGRWQWATEDGWIYEIEPWAVPGDILFDGGETPVLESPIMYQWW